MKVEGNEQYDVIVIGAGAAGMMIAGIMAEHGLKVVLLEKNGEIGKKLSITGGKRCNITNAEFDVAAFLEHFPQSKQFLYSPFSQFSVKDTFTFFEKIGVPIVIEENKRAFPKSQKATDVVLALSTYLEKHNVAIKLKTPVSAINAKEGRVVSVATPNRKYEASYFVLASGGRAAPETGSTGECFGFLSSIGHTVMDPSPSIVPLTTTAKWVRQLSGTKANVGLAFYQGGKVKLRKSGSLLFTHFGISGPMVLNSAAAVADLREVGAVEASIDFIPASTASELSAKLIELFELHAKMQVKNILKELVPLRIAVSVSGEIGEKTGATVTKEERQQIVNMLKDRRFPITGTRDFDEAVIADGGVDLREVDTKTMQSKKFPNLYLLGDVLNVNRPSGGYSLQLCWTTAAVAARAISKLFAKG
mgnify:CR=1 FL=1